MMFLISGLLALHFAVLWWLNKGVDIVVKSTRNADSEYKPTDFTIVVPFRNETLNIPNLIECLRKQKLENNSVNVIFINDHSTDNSVSQLEELTKNNFPFRTKLLNLEKSDGLGKKKALFKAVQTATTQFIIQIDCDVILKEKWLESVIRNVNMDTDLLVLPVSINGRKQWFQEFEFSALQFVTFGMAGNNTPILCNGANLVYRKSAWVDAFKSVQKGDSGDDIFLLQEFLATQQKLQFAYSKNLIVQTSSAVGYTNFIQQRLRWAGKNRNVSIPKYKLTTIYLGLLQLIPFIICVLNFKVGLPFLIFKIALDFYFVRIYRLRNEQSTSRIHFILSAFIMPLYLITLLFGQLLIKPKWKGRKVNV